jgi:aminodeoxyfutalosine synthase
MTSTVFDQQLERVAAGERLDADTIRQMAQAPDILPLGMLADALRRRLNGTRTTYLRLAMCPFDASFADASPVSAREIRISGHPPTLDVAASAVHAARAVAGGRAVSGLSWNDVTHFAAGGTPVSRVLKTLREAGLDAFAELPIDTIEDVGAAIGQLKHAGFDKSAIGQLKHAGFDKLRLTVEKMPSATRADLFLQLSELQQRFNCIESINPLPLALNAFRPTTGYEDVKMVAVARLAAPEIPHVQVDWMRYGPKLAQVALTFGADDVDGISASDDAPEGRRRAAVEEIRRNIQAAGFEAVERDGRFALL